MDKKNDSTCTNCGGTGRNPGSKYLDCAAPGCTAADDMVDFHRWREVDLVSIGTEDDDDAIYLYGRRKEREARAAASAPKAEGGTENQQARLAIDGAIQYGRENRNPPPSTDHWLYEYWNIGRQLATLGATGWDNVTPLESGAPKVELPLQPELPEPLEIDWPELHSQALGCGVEDRGIRDRYEAAAYGWQDAIDKAAERVPAEIYDADQMRAHAEAYARAVLAQAAPVGCVAVPLEKLRLIEAAMNHMGDALNNIDAVEEEDEDATAEAFRAIHALTSGAAPAAAPAPADGWISVAERLPPVGEPVFVFSPTTMNDWPGSLNISIDCIDPNDDEQATWQCHNENYEFYCNVGKSEGCSGPDQDAPYTHWMPLPAAPAPEAQ